MKTRTSRTSATTKNGHRDEAQVAVVDAHHRDHRDDAQDRPLDLRPDGRERVVRWRGSRGWPTTSRPSGCRSRRARRRRRGSRSRARGARAAGPCGLGLDGRAVGRPAASSSIGPASRAGRPNRGSGGARFIGRLPWPARPPARATAALKARAAGGVVDEHVEARGGRAEQHGRGPRPRRRPPCGDQRLARDGVGDPHGVLERRGALGPGQAGRRGTAPRASGPLSPISTAATARSATTGARLERSTSLSRPPAISTTGAVERAQRRDDRVGLRALRVVDEADAVDRARPARAGARRRVNAAAAARIASGAMPNSSPTATAARALETLWAPGSRELVDRHDPAAGAAVATARRRPIGERLERRPRRSSRRRRRRRPAAARSRR